MNGAYAIWNLNGQCIAAHAAGVSPADALAQACERSPHLLPPGKYIVAFAGDPNKSPSGCHQAAALFERAEVSVPGYRNKRVEA